MEVRLWYATCPDTNAPSHLVWAGVEAGSVAGVEAGCVAGVEAGSVAGVEAGCVAGIEAGSVATETEYHKRTKYQELDYVYLFMLLAIETSGAFGSAAAAFFFFY